MIETHSELEKEILTVSQLNRKAKELLESHFAFILIEGEVSNLSKPSSGHIYFVLKDQTAQVRCAMFRTRNSRIAFDIQNGMQILAYAKISLYEGRGDFQLIIDHLEERGEGLLRRQFEILKIKLAQEGLFDLVHKKKLPTFPKTIGVVTSPTGAAIHDVLSVLNRRFAAISVIIYPTQVQGEHAASQIAAAIALANDRCECDVLLICRGGGSLEDLWAFNEEIVARAIFQSKLPTVSAIGHEVDFTIADFVADQRAPTPSAAAELLSPNKEEYLNLLSGLLLRLIHPIRNDLKHHKIVLKNYSDRLIHPSKILQNYAQSVDILEQNLLRIMTHKLQQNQQKLQLSSLQLKHHNPLAKLKEIKTNLVNLERMLHQAIKQQCIGLSQKLANAVRALQLVNPLNTLERGYSITTKNQQIISSIETIFLNDPIKIELTDGYLFCSINKIIAK